VAVLHVAPVDVSDPATVAKPRGADHRSRRTLVLIGLVAVTPVIASYAFYYFFPRTTLANYGELLVTRPAPEISGIAADGKPFRLEPEWKAVLAVAVAHAMPRAQGAVCDAAGAHTAGPRNGPGAHVWFVTDEAMPPAACCAASGSVCLRADFRLAAWAAGPNAFIPDPLGNLVLASRATRTSRHGP
jgi:hypothetical protein